MYENKFLLFKYFLSCTVYNKLNTFNLYIYIYCTHTGQQGILGLARISSSFEQRFTPNDVIVAF